MSAPASLRLFALFGPTIGLLCLHGVTGHAYPGDVFVAGAPATGPAVHKATEVPVGSYSVSSETGAAQYSFPLAVPPGRGGLAPSYSSAP